MLKKAIIILILIICKIGIAQTPNFQWAKKIGGDSVDWTRAMAIDFSGNVYTIGSFGSSVDFDPGPGVFNLVSVGKSDIFISKLDALGNFVWARQISGPSGYILGSSIKTDAIGNIYITGSFRGTVDFDAGPGVFNLSSIGYADAFISKLDQFGNFIWAKQLEGSNSSSPSSASSLSFDALGNVYTTGGFNGTVDFDPGVGVYNLTSTGSGFISKLDASGNFVWAKQMGGSAVASSIDVSDNVYTTGDLYGTSDFDPGPGVFNLTSYGIRDVFISKLDAGGNFIWAKQIGGSSNSSQVRACSIEADALKNIYMSGSFTDTIDFDTGPGTFSLAPVGYGDIFVSKLDSLGNLIWARQFATKSYTHTSNCGALKLDASKNIYTTGSFQGTVDFNPGVGTYTIASYNIDAFVSKLDSAGNFVWAVQLGWYIASTSGTGIAIDASNNIYCSGQFQGTADFDPDVPLYNLTSFSFYKSDVFVQKMSQVFTGISESNLDNSFFVYPNPVINTLTVKTTEAVVLSLFDIRGKELISEVKSNTINLSELSQGLYFLTINLKGKQAVKKIIKE